MATGLSVEVSEVVKRYDSGLSPLKGVSFQLEAGKFLALIGPSGCGKSTLLKMIAHLRSPSSGKIQLGAQEPSQKRKLAYVFQDAQLLPWRTVLRNVTLPLEILGASKVEQELKARKALERVGLIDFEHYYPAHLSGGMRMRVSLARSLVNEPNLLLLDEPFAALDEVTRLKLDQDLRDLWQESQMTVIFVTHSISEAAFLSDRIILLSKKTGNIQYDLTNPLPPSRTQQTRALPAFSQLTQDLFVKFQELEA